MPKTKTRETVGKISSELLNKIPDTTDPIALERAMHGEYVDNIDGCVRVSRNDYPNNFFVVVITKKERVMQNVLRNYFFARSTCPTPDYDQTVYQYIKEDDRLDLLWVIPSKDACMMFVEQRALVDPSEYELLNFVLQFADSTLYKLSKKLNGEELKSNMLVQ